MSGRAAIAFASLLLGGCLDPGTTAGAGAPSERAGWIRTEVNVLDAPAGWTVVLDRRVEPEGLGGRWQGREVWVPSSGRLEFSAPCDAEVGIYDAQIRLVGAYAAAPGAIGPPGSPAPAGSPALREALRDVLGWTVQCVAGQDVFVQFDIALAEPTPRRGEVRVRMLMPGDDDALWDLTIENGDAPPRVVATERARYHEAATSWGVDLPLECDATPGVSRNELTARLIGVYGQDDPAESLETWPLPDIARRFTCVDETLHPLLLEVAVARVERDEAGVHARFAGIRCDAAVTCDELIPTFALDCEGAAPNGIAIHWDEPVLRCDDAEASTLVQYPDPSTTFEGVGDGLWRRQWRLTPTLDGGALRGRCWLELLATGVPQTELYPFVGYMDPEYGPTRVYPHVAWSVRVSDVDGPACRAAQLDVAGPVTVGYRTGLISMPDYDNRQ